MHEDAVDQGALRHLHARLPPDLEPLARLAFNYWWSWQPNGASLFRDIDPEHWDSHHGNPVALLSDVTNFARAFASDLPARAAAALARLDAELAAPMVPVGGADARHPVAYFCAEFGIHASLGVYGGGLGVLAGDFLKEASDRRLPVIGVGLFYHRGYFHQRLDLSGLQHEYWTTTDPGRLPMRLVRSTGGAPLIVHVDLRGHSVALQVWRVDVGRVPLFLLDSDVPGNAAVDRFVTGQLYVADRDVRLMQYAVLGIGGVRMLSALGIEPSIVHLNEGHAALAVFELIRSARVLGGSGDDALARARARVVFTTHTPVPAGNETYDPQHIGRILPNLAREVGATEEELLALGRDPGTPLGASFGMTQLGLGSSRSANGVSVRHGEVARSMWQGFFFAKRPEDVPISHVTNGVHLPTWMATPMRALLRRSLGDDWESAQDDPARWARILEIPDEELWALRTELRAALAEMVRARSITDRLDRGEPIEYVEAAAKAFDDSVLTVGFARRVATYKRLELLTLDPARALRLIGGDRPIQVVIAGKAHPSDDGAKRFVQTIFQVKRAPGVGTRVAFLEDYDLELARTMVAGCDVWLNVPRPPNEASGTSGMKCALNGGLHLSVLDGWWCEGFTGDNGWAIDSPAESDPAARDRRDASRLYDILEQQVVPSFYERDERGMPRSWLHRIKRSLVSLGPRFNASRMMHDYIDRMYLPAASDVAGTSAPAPSSSGRK